MPTPNNPCACNQGWRDASRWIEGRGWRATITDGDRTLWRCFHHHSTTAAAEKCALNHQARNVDA